MKFPRQAHARKSGPGRRHKDGTKTASPVQPKGAPFGFVQHTNPARRDRRELVANVGRRRALKVIKAARATARNLREVA